MQCSTIKSAQWARKTWYNTLLKILFWIFCWEEIIKVKSVGAGKLFAKVWVRDHDAWPTWRQQRDSVNELICLLNSGCETKLDMRMRDMPRQQG